MENFLLYILRSGLYIGIFYAFFLLVMRKTTFFRLNRILLLAGTFICMLLPVLRVRTIEQLAAAGQMQAIAGEGVGAGSAAASASMTTTWVLPVAIAFLMGCAAVLTYIFVSTYRMYRIVKAGERTVMDGYNTVISDTCKSSFSFGRLIVVGRQDLEENPVIFTHEKMHVRCRHYLDLFIYTAIQLLYWWNPLVWITRTELCLLHEYEADEGVISQGVEVRQYQLLLVRKAVGDERFIMASGFQHSKLKNRITMMLCDSTSRRRRWSYLAVLPCLAIAVFACNPAKVLEPESLEPEAVEAVGEFVAVPEEPVIQAGSAQDFSRFVNEILEYPDAAKTAGIQGRVTLSFVVENDGSITDVKLMRGVHPDLDAEALRVVTECAKNWRFDRPEGMSGKIHYMFPVVFQLR